MKLCKETITVVNAQVDPETGYDRYYATVISGASWYCEIAATVDASGLKAADKFTIRIPEDADFGGKAYVDPIAYATASPADTFTLRSGDTIVRGVADGADLSPAALRRSYAEVATVLGVTDNRRAPRAPHWKVVGA